MPDCQMCWNEWPTLTETPFPELAGIQVCRNCGRDMKKLIAFCRHHGVDLIPVPQVGLNSSELPNSPNPIPGEEPPKSPTEKKPAKAR